MYSFSAVPAQYPGPVAAHSQGRQGHGGHGRSQDMLKSSKSSSASSSQDVKAAL
jgi:hypothetical protein